MKGIPPHVLAKQNRMIKSHVQCGQCGYDLHGTRGDRCPECGRRLPERRPRQIESHWAIFCAIWLLAMVLSGLVVFVVLMTSAAYLRMAGVALGPAEGLVDAIEDIPDLWSDSLLRAGSRQRLLVCIGPAIGAAWFVGLVGAVYYIRLLEPGTAKDMRVRIKNLLQRSIRRQRRHSR